MTPSYRPPVFKAERDNQRAYWAERHAALGRAQDELVRYSTQQIAKSRELLEQTKHLVEEPAVDELADQFAAQAVKSALSPAPDGLDVFGELAKATRILTE